MSRRTGLGRCPRCSTGRLYKDYDATERFWRVACMMCGHTAAYLDTPDPLVASPSGDVPLAGPLVDAEHVIHATFDEMYPFGMWRFYIAGLEDWHGWNANARGGLWELAAQLERLDRGGRPKPNREPGTQEGEPVFTITAQRQGSKYVAWSTGGEPAEADRYARALLGVADRLKDEIEAKVPARLANTTPASAPGLPVNGAEPDTSSLPDESLAALSAIKGQLERLEREGNGANPEHVEPAARATGRPPVLSPEERAEVAARYAAGESPAALAEEVGVSRSTVLNAARQAGVPKQRSRGERQSPQPARTISFGEYESYTARCIEVAREERESVLEEIAGFQKRLREVDDQIQGMEAALQAFRQSIGTGKREGA